MTRNKVLVANGQGFWGDSLLGPVRLANEGPLDYLTLDYLAEVTMSILQKLKSRNPNAGYATDFVDVVRRIMPICKDKGVRIIANAGGVNPTGCGDAVRAALKDLGLRGTRVATVRGDDILDQLPQLLESGQAFKNMDTGEDLSPVLDRVKSANVYIGAEPIVQALGEGADIVITGRATDPSLVVAPLVHEFGWSLDDFDKLAAGTVAGHIVECGAQCTGGNFSDWRDIPGLHNIGYPVIEASPDGSFVVTKHEGTGGRVDLRTVSSQLVYEMGDPNEYITPDCIADFTSIQLEESGPDRVSVSGIKGRPATDTYKVSITYHNGYKIVGQLTIAGPDAIEKAHLCADIVFRRAAMDGVEIPESERFVELVGASSCHAGIVPPPEDPGEVVLRIGAKGQDRDKLERLGREIVPLVTSGPPGVTGFSGGRPKATDIIAYWPALMAKACIQPDVVVEEV